MLVVDATVFCLVLVKCIAFVEVHNGKVHRLFLYMTANACHRTVDIACKLPIGKNRWFHYN